MISSVVVYHHQYHYHQHSCCLFDLYCCCFVRSFVCLFVRSLFVRSFFAVVSIITFVGMKIKELSDIRRYGAVAVRCGH